MSGVTRSDVHNIAQTIANARVSLDALIDELGPHVWLGPDAESFRSRWESQVSAQLLSYERATRNMNIETYRG